MPITGKIAGLSLFAASMVLSTLSAALQSAESAALRNQDPGAALLSTTDIALFWRAYDRWTEDYNAQPDKLADVLQRDYLDKGSQGVRDFTPYRIVSADNLAKKILEQRAYYESVRKNTELIATSMPEVRKGFRELKRLYPDATFPPVYFVIGALNSGGTSTDHGLIIGAEMLSDANPATPTTDAVAIVMHELIHFQQKASGHDLLSSCLREGGADFFAELVAGRNINERNKAFGDSHEEELWRQFLEDIKHDGTTGYWLYNYREKRRPGWPADLGYYVGYKILQSYFQLATDKSAALKAIIELREPQKLLQQSGYEGRFSKMPRD